MADDERAGATNACDCARDRDNPQAVTAVGQVHKGSRFTNQVGVHEIQHLIQLRRGCFH